ncbi:MULTISPECIES: hypothetical protein [Delftia]|uniref:Uncharacterized protein n=1 Tax=Delftia lacustris TaxID=558537 RepID=A0A7T2YWM9_9BURK|nr:MULTISPECIES: hypothetical protein [Delftia]EPD42318.1 hypothetical protein HMPREF9702_02508 [Delftia acidovorans CCUG 15835]QPS83065.1 hypothetical protein I6G47_08315 [Delftia lacustris]
MGEINIPRAEHDALRVVECDVLDQLVDQCVREERPSVLRPLQLESCGPYVASKLRAFDKAMDTYGKAKAEKKRAETRYDALSAGRDLVHAVLLMKQRMATEEEEGERFYVDDLVLPPPRFGEKMSVRVSYRWRPSAVDPWAYGDITMSHDVDTRPDYSLPPPKRKPSAAGQAQQRQETLYREWEHLKSLALHSIRDYFRNGGNGAEIPKVFQVKPDAHTRGLNNFSAKFWL